MNRFLLIIFFVIAFFTFADNPFADFAGTDSAVFNYVGMRMHAGLVPYKDIFDHKGFLIYFINWLGMFLGPSMIGVWLIELSMFLISSFLVCRWSEKVFNNKVAFFALFPYIALFCYCADAGNLTESYAHLFILFVLLSLFEATICRPTMRTWLFCGGCLSCILCLRPNMAVVAFLVPVYCLEELLRHRSWRSIIFACLMISLGMAVVLVPVLVYLALNGALLACLDCYWKFNVRYAAGGAWAWDCKLLFGIVLALFTIPICFETRFRRMGIYNLVFIVLTTFVLAMRAIFLHYYVILVPGTLLVFTWYLNKLAKFVCVQRFVMSGLAVLAVALVSLQALKANFDISELVKFVKSGGSVSRIADFRDGFEMHELDAFRSTIDARKGVCVIGNSCLVYRRLNVYCKSRYPFQAQPISVSEHALRDVVAALSNKLDGYLITVNGKVPAVLYDSIRNNYQVCKETAHFSLWEAFP